MQRECEAFARADWRGAGSYAVSPNTTNATATLVGVVINPTIFEIIKNILDMRAFPAARFRRSKMTGSSTPYHKPRHKRSLLLRANPPATSAYLILCSRGREDNVSAMERAPSTRPFARRPAKTN
jgi:hypothetical protein